MKLQISKFITKLFFSLLLRRAIRNANELEKLTGLRYYVYLLRGAIKVSRKRDIKSLIKRKRLRCTIEQFEQRCLHITK
ncbi:MAG: hypothetical protein ACRCZB_02805 [Bacteroidales bacterium]